MTRVIKVGGRPQADPALPALLACAHGEHPGETIVVHGGGDEVSSLQRALGSTPQFIDGRRITTETDIVLVRMALSGVANKRLVASLTLLGVRALGLSGEDGPLLTARPTAPDRLGLVGTPNGVNVQLLQLLMNAGYMPVISPVSNSSSLSASPALNVNGDDAAAAIAVAMMAEELLLVSDVPAVLDRGAPLTQLTPESAESLLADGTAEGGMRAKLQAALTAINGGVERVRISDLAAIGDAARGTILTRAGVCV